MWTNLTQKILLALVLGTVSLMWAGETAGTVVTPGRILIDDLAIRGNASVKEGSVLKTSTEAARIELSGGGALALDAKSEAVIRRDGLNLRQGKAMLLSGQGTMEALGLRIGKADAASKVFIAAGPSMVEVAALEGAAQVRNRQGLILAMVEKGKPLRFEPGMQGNESTVTGTLRREGSRFALKDELTGIDVELKGTGLTSQSGNRIQATGESKIAGDSGRHVILVSKLNRLETVPEPAASGTSPSTSTSTAAAKTGMTAGTKISLAALAFGGMAAAIAVPLAMSN